MERKRERDKEREKVIRTFFMCACVFMRVCELWSVCVSKYRSLRSVVCTRNEKRFAISEEKTLSLLQKEKEEKTLVSISHFVSLKNRGKHEKMT